MTIRIESKEQFIELAARSLYLLSSYRYWEKDYENEPSPEVRKFVERDRERIDEFLNKIGLVDFRPLKDIIEELANNISINNENQNTQ